MIKLNNTHEKLEIAEGYELLIILMFMFTASNFYD